MKIKVKICNKKKQKSLFKYKTLVNLNLNKKKLIIKLCKVNKNNKLFWKDQRKLLMRKYNTIKIII